MSDLHLPRQPRTISSLDIGDSFAFRVEHERPNPFIVVSIRDIDPQGPVVDIRGTQNFPRIYQAVIGQQLGRNALLLGSVAENESPEDSIGDLLIPGVQLVIDHREQRTPSREVLPAISLPLVIKPAARHSGSHPDSRSIWWVNS
jgi:hypothetical protein